MEKHPTKTRRKKKQHTQISEAQKAKSLRYQLSSNDDTLEQIKVMVVHQPIWKNMR